MAGLTAARSVLMVHSLQAMQQPEIHHHTCVALRRMPTASLAELRSQLVGSSNLLLRHCVQPSRRRGFFVAAAAADIGCPPLKGTFGEMRERTLNNAELVKVMFASTGRSRRRREREEEGDVEEVAGLLEPPVDSIDEAYVEALDEGTLPDDGGEEQEEDEGEDVEDLKQGLIDSLYGTQRGLRASSDTRAEVIELITQLEAKNPTPAPTEALNLLNGKWILAYTSYSELYPLLAAGNLPLLKVGEISQTIDAIAFTVENSVSFEGPLTTTSFSTSASFEVRSPKRVQIKFEEGVIGTPKLTDSIEVPSEVDIMGQKVDLTPIRGLLRPLQHVAMSVARTISGQPPLKFPIQADRAQSWLLTTFLDEDVRISRGDGGSVFVLVREGSPLLY